LIDKTLLDYFSDFCTRFAHSLLVGHVENLDLSNNALEDKGRFVKMITKN
jgi:hypothetical protein